MTQETPDFEISFFEGLVQKNPMYVEALIPLAEAYTKRGLYEKGLRIDKRLARLRKHDPVVRYNLACSFALVGKKEEAFLTLKRAVKLGYNEFEYLKKDPDLKSLRGDPRFQSLLSTKASRP